MSKHRGKTLAKLHLSPPLLGVKPEPRSLELLFAGLHDLRWRKSWWRRRPQGGLDLRLLRRENGGGLRLRHDGGGLRLSSPVGSLIGDHWWRSTKYYEVSTGGGHQRVSIINIHGGMPLKAAVALCILILLLFLLLL